MVNNNLIQILKSIGLFLYGLPLEDPYSYTSNKVKSVCISSVERPTLNIDTIRLRVFSLLFTCDDTIWLFELLYNSITTWDGVHKVFLDKYFPLSKKLNLKDKLYKFIALHGESVRSFWDRFIGFMKSVPNPHIDDDSLNEYFRERC